MTWDPNESPVNYILLAGLKSPGVAEVQGASAPRTWDVRKTPGSSGATLVYKGAPPAHFKVLIRLSTAQHWIDWDTFQYLVQRPPTDVRPQAMDISHPILELLSIRSVVVEDMIQPLQTSDGEWTVEVRFIENRPAVPALVRSHGSTTNAQTITDPVEARIAVLTTQHQINQIALGAGG